MFDLIVHGKVVENGELVESYICIKEGLIEDVRRSEPGSGSSDQRMEAGSSFILPGGMDLHTHMREPGMERKEDFFTGTLSAAFGGVTAIVDMPNTIPPTGDGSTFIHKKGKASEKACIDFGLNVVIKDDTDLTSFYKFSKDPAFNGFKIFLGETTGSLVLKDTGRIEADREILAGFDRPISVHAEDGMLLKGIQESRSKILRRHLESRPAAAEVSAMEMILMLMGERSDLLHFLHVSSSRGIERAATSDSTIEVTPHHLLLDVKKCEKDLENESFGKVNPPIRTPDDRAALWKYVNNGRVDTIGSDHAPHELTSKDSENPPSGMPGVETMIPLMLNQVKERRLSVKRLVELVSHNPAKRIGVQGRGSISPGCIADLILVDMNEVRRIRSEDLHSRCGWTPYEGMNGIFPEKVISRGELIIENEQFCSKRGRGRPIRQR